MRFVRQVHTLVLLAAVVWAMTAADAWTPVDDAHVPSAPLGHGAPCHVHGDMDRSDSLPVHPPSPHTPVSYLCCLTSHVVAAVHASDSLRIPAQFAPTPFLSEPILAVSFLSPVEGRALVFTDPPGAIPLQI